MHGMDIRTWCAADAERHPVSVVVVPVSRKAPVKMASTLQVVASVRIRDVSIAPWACIIQAKARCGGSAVLVGLDKTGAGRASSDRLEDEAVTDTF